MSQPAKPSLTGTGGQQDTTSFTPTINSRTVRLDHTFQRGAWEGWDDRRRFIIYSPFVRLLALQY